MKIYVKSCAEWSSFGKGRVYFIFCLNKQIVANILPFHEQLIDMQAFIVVWDSSQTAFRWYIWSTITNMDLFVLNKLFGSVLLTLSILR